MPTDTLLTRTKQFLKDHDLRARKGLAQHFLVDGGVVRKILTAAEITPSDTVIEVGPGLGVLTQELIKSAGRVIAVELDTRLAEIIKEKLTSGANLTVVHENILKTDPAELLASDEVKGYKVVANLPYYITSAVIRHFLEASLKPDIMVLMVQREVAKQITARPGEMSLLSVSVQLYGEPKLVARVPARSFYPAPRVDSAILKINVYPAEQVAVEDITGFFDLVRAGFSANRKQIVNSLAKSLDIPKPGVLSLLEKAGIDPRRRAETLTIDEWRQLFRVFSIKSGVHGND